MSKNGHLISNIVAKKCLNSTKNSILYFPACIVGKLKTRRENFKPIVGCHILNGLGGK